LPSAGDTSVLFGVGKAANGREHLQVCEGAAVVQSDRAGCGAALALVLLESFEYVDGGWREDADWVFEIYR